MADSGGKYQFSVSYMLRIWAVFFFWGLTLLAEPCVPSFFFFSTLIVHATYLISLYCTTMRRRKDKVVKAFLSTTSLLSVFSSFIIKHLLSPSYTPFLFPRHTHTHKTQRGNVTKMLNRQADTLLVEKQFSFSGQTPLDWTWLRLIRLDSHRLDSTGINQTRLDSSGVKWTKIRSRLSEHNRKWKLR